MSGSISSSQFQAVQPDMTPPLSLSKATTGSAAQSTAWRNSSLGKGGPQAYSAKTRGTTFNWDDTAASPSLPQSDKGAGRNQ
jgi:hypothetical protein